MQDKRMKRFQCRNMNGKNDMCEIGVTSKENPLVLKYLHLYFMTKILSAQVSSFHIQIIVTIFNYITFPNVIFMENH